MDQNKDVLNNLSTFSLGITESQAMNYLDSVNSHVHYVRIAGTSIGVPMEQLLAHDQSKYSIDEFPYYARHYFGDKGDPYGYSRAWLHHIHHNPHHWQHWIFSDGFTLAGSLTEGGAVPMPEAYIREMVADWLGAERLYQKKWDMGEWLKVNLPKITLHSISRAKLHDILAEIGYDPRDLYSREMATAYVEMGILLPQYTIDERPWQITDDISVEMY